MKKKRKNNKKSLQLSTTVYTKGKKSRQSRKDKKDTGNPGTAYERLDYPEQIAIDLRLYNMSYEAIAAEMQKEFKKRGMEKKAPKEQTLRSWFEKGGKCKEAYEEKKKMRAEENKARIAEMDKKLIEAAVDGVIVLHKKIRKDNLQAALETVKIVKEGKNKDKNPVPNNTIIYIPSNGRG